MLMHALALRLGKTMSEIEAIPYAEFIGWIAYFELMPKG
ncbi:hypothetical protein J2X13_000755 [Aminobacter aminovorans]|nr:hypothetical protein [Aminobacter aminovorans]